MYTSQLNYYIALSVGEIDIENRKFYAISASTPIAYGDFKNYRIADRGGVAMQRLNELYAGTGHVGFRMRKRTDGKLLVAESIKKLTMAV